MQVSESKFKSLNAELNLTSSTNMFDSQVSHQSTFKVWATPTVNLKLDTYKHILLIFIDYIDNTLLAQELLSIKAGPTILSFTSRVDPKCLLWLYRPFPHGPSLLKFVWPLGFLSPSACAAGTR